MDLAALSALCGGRRVGGGGPEGVLDPERRLVSPTFSQAVSGHGDGPDGTKLTSPMGRCLLSSALRTRTFVFDPSFFHSADDGMKQEYRTSVRSPSSCLCVCPLSHTF